MKNKWDMFKWKGRYYEGSVFTKLKLIIFTLLRKILIWKTNKEEFVKKEVKQK